MLWCVVCSARRQALFTAQSWCVSSCRAEGPRMGDVCQAGRCRHGRDACLMSMRACGKKARRMASFNKVILLGHLTRDPAVRFTPNGTPVASFGLAVNTPRSGQSGPEPGGQGSLTERREDVCFVDIVAFGRQ